MAPAFASVQMGTANDDAILGLTLDAEERLYVVGYENGLDGTTNLQPAGSAGGFVGQVVRDGSFAWKRAFDTAGPDTVEAIALGSSGSIVVAGRTTGVLAGTANAGQFDLFLAELTREGEVSSTWQTGRKQPEHPRQLALDGAGRVLVAGHDDLYIPSNFVESDEDGFIAALDAGPGGFDEAWWRRSGSEIGDRVTDIALDPVDGAAFVTGFENGGGTRLEKIDATGALLWSLTPDALGGQAFVVALSPNGQPIVAGGVIVPPANGAPGGPGFWVSERDRATGAATWSAFLPASGFVEPTGIAFDAKGRVHVAGHVFGSLEGQTSAGGEDVFEVRLTATGTIENVWQQGTPEDDVATSLVVDACGRPIVAGYTSGSWFGNASGRRDAFITTALE